MIKFLSREALCPDGGDHLFAGAFMFPSINVDSTILEVVS